MSIATSSITVSNKKSIDGCVFKGFICIQESFRPDCGYRGQGECLCLRKTICLECCCDNNDIEPRIVGLDLNPTGNGEICKLGCYCCDYTIIQPRILCGSAAQVLCLQTSASLPFHEDYLNEPVCAMYCLQCVPRCGCVTPPPACPVLYGQDKTPAIAYPVTSIDPMDRGNNNNKYIPMNCNNTKNDMEMHPMVVISDKDIA